MSPGCICTYLRRFHPRLLPFVGGFRKARVPRRGTNCTEEVLPDLRVGRLVRLCFWRFRSDCVSGTSGGQIAMPRDLPGQAFVTSYPAANPGTGATCLVSGPPGFAFAEVALWDSWTMPFFYRSRSEGVRAFSLPRDRRGNPPKSAPSLPHWRLIWTVAV